MATIKKAKKEPKKSPKNKIIDHGPPPVWDTPTGNHPGGRPLKYKNVEGLKTLIDRYFSEADIKEEPYTITGLGLVLGLDRDQICNYAKKDEFASTIKEAKQKVEAYAERRLYTGGQAAGPIFALKNFGWKDRTEVAVDDITDRDDDELLERLNELLDQIKQN